MPKPIDLPGRRGPQFLKDMLAFLAEKDSLKRDEIAARQIHVLREYQGKHERPIKLHEVKQMFHAMKDHA
jgi:hypothetical protein